MTPDARSPRRLAPLHSALLVAGLALFAACKTEPLPAAAPAPLAAEDAAATLAASAAPRPGEHHAPLPQSELPTTDGAIAMGNLDAQLAGAERRAAMKPPLAQGAMQGLVGYLATRGAILGRIADVERAAEIAERLVKLYPDGPGYLLRASMRASFHRFEEALADLAEAQKRGVNRYALDEQRASVLQALGRTDEALALGRQRPAGLLPTLGPMVAEATLHADRGELDEAEKLFVEAQYHYRDVSPFPIAWLYLQQGLMWQREGQLGRARALFAEAHERLPMHAAVASHLATVEAATGARDRAIALLAPIVAQADDPEYAGQLAQLYRDGGRAAEAEKLRGDAAKRFGELLARHPAAYADHAARFWLAVGGDAKKALALAQMNLAARKTSDAHELLLEAALAAGDPAIGCATADEAAKLRHRPPHLRIMMSRAYDACGKKDRAAATLGGARRDLR